MPIILTKKCEHYLSGPSVCVCVWGGGGGGGVREEGGISVLAQTPNVREIYTPSD